MQRILKEILILGVAAVAIIYIGNPGAGFIELIPDNFPIIGNLDEAGAVLILISVLRHYGVDPTRLLVRDDEAKPKGIPQEDV
jgi:uncharacterized membrane protein YkvA (DUF1232 family)